MKKLLPILLTLLGAVTLLWPAHAQVTQPPTSVAAGTGVTVSGSVPSFTVNATSYVLDRSTTEQDVTNSSTETAVYTYTNTLSSILGTNGVLRLTTTGYVDLSSVSSSLTIRVKFGGTTIATSTPIATASSKTGLRIVTDLVANGATNSQRAVTTVAMLADSVVGVDGTLAVGNSWITAHSSLAIDTTASQTLTVTFQWNAINANAHAKRWGAILERL